MTTTIPSNYDFSDPAVVKVVDENHCPYERTATTGTTFGTTVTVELLCSKDDQPWPCPIIEARRAWQAPA